MDIKVIHDIILFYLNKEQQIYLSHQEIDAVLDTGCYIFQVVEVEGDNGEHVLVIGADQLHWSKDSRLFNTVTGSYPCMLHLPGGYSDPHFGKLDLVKGWYEQF